MGVRILHDSDDETAALYCSTSEVAFGPLFHDEGNYSAEMRAESFLRFLGVRDARQFTDKGLLDLYGQWLAQEEEQWKREEAPDDVE